jgi:hypothetical protein
LKRSRNEGVNDYIQICRFDSGEAGFWCAKTMMIPVGYLAKRSCAKPAGFQSPMVEDVYSVSGCVNEDFADYIGSWKHNGYWLFDSPAVIQEVAREKSISLDSAKFFYYEAYEFEFTGKEWRPFSPETSVETDVVTPSQKALEGFDVVTFYAGTTPECSPLSCNGLAGEIPTNSHCLIETLDNAKDALESGRFEKSEHGPYRIFAVYSVDWPAT